MKKIEIERKFLIKMPDVSMLDFNSIIQIEQTYTLVGVRLRKWTENGKTIYIKTVKQTLTDLSRIENEEEISSEEYRELFCFADPNRKTLKKTRYRYSYQGKVIEIDVFPFWTKQALCEVELESEDEKFNLPKFIEVIREVTSDKAYKNHALSKEIPKEENF
ncbi:MAG: hypothetical protein E7540_00385 [Ruminococcaceae bacterium]|nr:hypothetical protein [Oscillospiraceae bacterium]